MLGRPYYNVYLGRKDSRLSSASSIEGKLPKPTMGMSQINLFASSGFTVQEMMALSGAHTIGFSHCKDFSSNVGNDTHYNPRFAQALKQVCADYPKNPTLSVLHLK
ncbi:hypothetical protein like AT3G28200 [Hibiscus trionum]|uniref:peroxidase n=1 Tax=Hibiscus trionum TaxID=183268 RepID=A0A9W7MUM3_HIBTR|nr:hypothetical protein like AT3G28200 [Hibiscus trionum]